MQLESEYREKFKIDHIQKPIIIIEIKVKVKEKDDNFVKRNDKINLVKETKEY
jgi:hypothetical protein